MSFFNRYTIRTRLIAMVCLTLSIMSLLIGVAWVKNPPERGQR